MAFKVIGKYEIIEKLGEGATSEVYRARDSMLGREVALKVLKPALVTDASAFDRFVQEAQTASGLFHPNIATVLDMGESKGRYFIAMRYIPGRSLYRQLKEEGPLTWDQVKKMTHQVGDALETAHLAGFIHRDVKPSNVICSTTGDYFMTDFGLVRAMMTTGFTSHAGAMVGTPEYIAPEIWNGDKASPASDQYALACVVFEAVTGQALFEGSTTQEIIAKHLIKSPAIPDSMGAEIPAGLSTILRKALDKEPAQRFQRVSEFSWMIANLPGPVPPTSVQAPVKPADTRVNSPQISEPKISTLSGVSLIAGCISFFYCFLIFPLLFSIPAVICGHLALREIGKSQGKLSGREEALGGLILGYLTLILSCVLFLLFQFGDQILNPLGRYY